MIPWQIIKPDNLPKGEWACFRFADRSVGVPGVFGSVDDYRNESTSLYDSLISAGFDAWLDMEDM